MKQLFLRKCNVVLVALLGVFGFSCSCDNGDNNYLMYGVRQPAFIVKGAVTDKTEQPIEGIQVRTIRTFVNSNGEEQTFYLAPKRLTDEEGNFKLVAWGLNAHSSATIHFSDIDGEKNGLFENKIVKLNIEDFEEKEPDWVFVKRLDVKLTPKMDEDEDYEENIN